MAYFDAASAEPVLPQAKAALLAALDEGWADQARLHREGRRARLMFDQARERVAGVIGCRADEVMFTASGTEAVHRGVLGAVAARRSATRGPGHIVVSAVEHSSVLNAVAHAEEAGGTVTIIGADSQGRVDAAGFARAVRTNRTVLACLQSANQEVGTIQPAAELAAECAAAGVPLLCDAAVSIGRLQLPAGWSILAASAHKWGGPPGVGVLAVRTQVRWRPPGPSGVGFPNLPAILAATAALETCEAGRDAADAALRPLVALIRQRLPELVDDCVVHGDPVATAPHIVTFSCLYVDGEALVTELDKAGFSVSSGSACASDTEQPSHVLAAMGAVTHGNVRVSLPRGTTRESVMDLLDVLPGIVERVRRALARTSASHG